MHPFDRFTPNAKLALQLAEQEAKTMKSQYIGSEHLLLGLLGIPKSLGFSILTGAGVTPKIFVFFSRRKKVPMMKARM
jgi:ATP-dependent Clp protease ATP-binding subunit ClpA